MKRHWIAAKSILLVLILISGFATAANADTAVQSVKVGVSFSPYSGPNVFFAYSDGTSYYGQINPDSGEVEGYFVDLFHEIEKADASLSFEIIPIHAENVDKLSEILSESGCDLLTGWGVGTSDKYEMFSRYRPLTFERLVYVTNDPDTPLVLTMADLADRKIAVPENYVPSEMILGLAEEESVTIDLVEIQGLEWNLIIDAIINGEYDAFLPLNFLNMYKYDLSKLGISSVSEVDRHYERGIQWAYLKDKKELADYISETLYNMMKEGALTELCKSYFRVDVSQVTDDPEWAENLWHPYDNYY